MGYKVKIKLADDTVKTLTIGSDVELTAGLGLTMSQIQNLFNALGVLVDLFEKEHWKSVEIEPV